MGNPTPPTDKAAEAKTAPPADSKVVSSSNTLGAAQPAQPPAPPPAAPEAPTAAAQGQEPEVSQADALGLSQQTIDEMEAGAKAIARRNTAGRRKDALDVAEANSNAVQDRANRIVK